MPSKKVLEQKMQVVDTLADKISNSVSGVIVRYAGITVEDDTKLRAELRAAGVEYSVIKNTLIGRACEKVGFGELKQYLEGMNAVAISKDDAVAPAKILKKYADKIETFELSAGFLEGQVVDTSVINELANIPPKEILIGKVLGSIQSPLYSLAYVLQAIVDKGEEFMTEVENKAKEEAKAEEAPAEEAKAEEAPAEEAKAEEAPAEEAKAEEAPAEEAKAEEAPAEEAEETPAE